MKVKINNCMWQIKECASDSVPLCDGSFFGRTYFFDKCVYLNKDITKDQKIKTLRHELTHVFLMETQIANQDDVKYTEEMLCEFVAMYGLQIQRIVDKYFDTYRRNSK